MRFAIIATKERFTEENIDDFSVTYQLNKLTFDREVGLKMSLKFNFDEQYIDFFTTPQGTLAFFSSPDILEDAELERSSFENMNGAFWIDEASHCCRVNIYENLRLLVNRVEINSQVKQDLWQNFVLPHKSNREMVVKGIRHITGIDFQELKDITLKRFVLTKEKPAVSSRMEKILQQVNSLTDISQDAEPIAKVLKLNNDSDYTEQVFLRFISEDDAAVLAALDSLSNNGMNDIIHSYLQNLAYFHRDKKVRNKAKKLLAACYPPETITLLDEQFKPANLKEQDYYIKPVVYHERMRVGEYVLLGSVTRRHYFEKYQATAYNLYMDGRGDDIRNALNISIPLDELPDKIGHLGYLDYVYIALQDSLNLPDLFSRLSLLPALRTLKLRKCNVESIPKDIYKLQSLERLVFSGCPITEFSFDGTFPYLKELEISDTRIQQLDLKGFPALTTLRVSGKEQTDRLKIRNNLNELLITSGKYYSETRPASLFLEEDDTCPESPVTKETGSCFRTLLRRLKIIRE